MFLFLRLILGHFVGDFILQSDEVYAAKKKGFGGASISGMKYSIPRLVSGITRSLFEEDRQVHFEDLCAFEAREF